MQPILFKSTRASPGSGQEETVGIETAIVRGMPKDGGLYVPTSLPRLPARIFDLSPLSYADLAFLVLEPFFSGWGRTTLASILEKAYGRGAKPYFDIAEVSPLIPLAGLSERPEENEHSSLYLLELFHGKTCAFKDMALSVLGGLLRESLDRLGMSEPVLVLTATSGDTGSAALEGLSSIEGIRTAVIYPAAGTSEIQRLQMTTVDAQDRFVASIEGDFDDAQSAVKAIFSRAAQGKGPLSATRLSSANSINIGRLLPQIVYYVKAWRDLAARGALGLGGIMHVAVPTGNFGDILAAKYAKEMGLPICDLVCASNANKVLADFFATGIYDGRRELIKTDSPSMDILVSSNLERLLFMASGENPGRVVELMGNLAACGWFEIGAAEKAYVSDFKAGWCSDGSARATIAKVWNTCKVLIDPHTATAVEVATRTADAASSVAPVVVAATASPFKFPAACLGALGDTDSARAIAAGAGRGAADPRGDLALAVRLAEFTGLDMPGQILALASKKVVHDRALEVKDVEEELARFALSNRKASL